MASNEIPKTYSDVVILAENAAAGASTHAAALGLKQNTGPDIRADVDALTTAAATAARRRSDKAVALKAHQAADAKGEAFIARFTLLEKPRLGSAWGLLWQEAGFSAGSLAMPASMDDRFALLGRIVNFLRNHPECVVTDPARPDLDVTEAAAATLHEAIATARSAVNARREESSAATIALKAALKTMRRRLSGLRDELTQLPLPADSPLWFAFGFRRPADPTAPGAPARLVLAAGESGTGMLLVDWDPAARATGYRVKIGVPGEAAPRVHPLVSADQTAIPGLPIGVPLTVTLSAHNAAGDGPDSAPATLTLT